MSHTPDSDDEGHDERPGNSDLIDLEAVESSGSGDSEDADDELVPEFSFPQFGRLPVELRRQIWEHFCPALTATNVWEFRLSRRNGRTGPWVVGESATLWQQTEPVRTVLATHQESRSMAVSVFPDTLALRQGEGLIRFRSDRDVVLVSGENIATKDIQEKMSITGFCENIVHLAVDESLWELFSLDEWYHPISLSLHFPCLKAAYVCVDSDEHEDQNLLWCTSDAVNQFHLTTTQIEEGLGEDAEFVYCWPDLARHTAFANQEVPFNEFNSTRCHLDLYRSNLSPRGVEVWPMVRFGFETGIERFQKLASGAVDDGDGDEDDEDDEESDDYESEGINDGEIEEQEWTEEEDGDLVVLQDDSDEDGASFHGFSPLQPADAPGVEEFEVARFSSPISVSNSEHESEDSASDEGPITAPRRSKKRRIVASSDAEDDSAAEPAPKRARRATVVLSDSEDDEDEKDEEDDIRRPNIKRRRPRAAVVDDESDEEAQDDDGDEGDEGEEEEDEESEEEEEAGPKRPLSLVERLRLGREENPIPDRSNSDEGEEEEEEDDGDEDAYNYRSHRRRRRPHGAGRNGRYLDISCEGNFDDEDEEDEDEERGNGNGNGIFDDMAEESGDEGDGPEGEDEW